MQSYHEVVSPMNCGNLSQGSTKILTNQENHAYLSSYSDILRVMSFKNSFSTDYKMLSFFKCGSDNRVLN
jgi:hypothetical protein